MGFTPYTNATDPNRHLKAEAANLTAAVKVFLSSDIEGTAGIVDWEQARGPGAEYEIGRQLLIDEVNAAIDGAVDAGASHILVNDAHRTMYNLRPGDLHHRASYLSGRR